MNTKTNVREWPLVKPILALFASRKFVLAVATLIGVLIVRAVPELEGAQDTIVNVLIVLFGALVGTITIEDVANAKKEAPKTYDEARKQLEEEFKAYGMELAKKYLEPATTQPGHAPIDERG